MKMNLIVFFSIFKKVLILILKLLFCLFITALLIMHLAVILFSKEISFQIIFYQLFSIIILIGLWVTIFTKTNKHIKIIYVILFIMYLFLPRFLPFVKKTFDKDFCLDSGICQEGLELNTEYGRIKINKENCLKYNWKWDEKGKECNVREKTK